ncbi:MAG: CHAT domain-containing protein [Symploca sp. SIO1C2]|nr:CHAT domain-containing protein [Symploca sp. SIO1C2]
MDKLTALAIGILSIVCGVDSGKVQASLISSSVEYLHLGENKAEGRGQKAEGKKEDCKVEGNYNCLSELDITPSPITNNQPPTLEQEAQQLYERGQYTAAVELLKQIINNYATQGDTIGEAIAQRNLALVYQRTGEWHQAEKAIAKSFNLLQQLADSPDRTRLMAQTLDVQGQLQLSTAQPEKALATWQQASDHYQQINDPTGSTRSQINQVQALRAMGFYDRATKTLEKIQTTLAEKPDNLLKAKALHSLGDVLQKVGKLNQSQATLEESLAIAEKLLNSEAVAATLLSLGNTTRLQNQPEDALNYYQQSFEQATSPELQIQAQLNQLNLLVNQEKWSEAKALLPQIQSQLNQLPPNQQAIYARINLARSLMKGEIITNEQNVAQLLARAIQEAQNLGDKRAEAYGLGSLGNLYEQHQRWEEALELTEKALRITSNAPDLAYQWQWQLGRILKEQGKPEEAIVAYTQSKNILKSIRSDLVAISSDVQFSFKESVEPVYRELAELLLQPGANQDNLKKAREVIEALQLAELDNFFRDACLDATSHYIDDLDPTAAIFYTIILDNSLEVILALPGQDLLHYTTDLSQVEIEDTLTKLRASLAIKKERKFTKKRLKLSQKVHDWLISPIEADLAANSIENLVFVLDGALRNISIAALYDGDKYVVEKYGVALAPSLKLIDPKPLVREQIQVLSGGLTEARHGFEALPNVNKELQRIQAQVPAEILLNQSFTNINFKTAVNDNTYPVVHLATHGEFSSHAQETFLLTWNGKLQIEELNTLLRADTKQTNPIELLVLSACKTAAGDNRAALGLAGVAVRAGARSTAASLWYVSDEATAFLMNHFYQELAKPNITKAEALRRAQLAVLQQEEFAHPYYWSAFVLVGNWL